MLHMLVIQVLTRAVQAWDEQEKTIVSTTTAGPDGEFCFLLPIGNYVVKVIVTVVQQLII